ncbi:hypothetical protein [Hymenobacter edaphi]|uniref:Outer membrane protein beta-barrel domain-containing protein n=1 Tax=Hymenobacter edaphi TaxID=2211146 RepID=A0A328BRI9_9BACT|nr:hypothetical protein [Hymenobacter edaphi]RAK69707.1 hypothetical protein DLM85_02305 [Hymenobacter edaphi]
MKTPLLFFGLGLFCTAARAQERPPAGEVSLHAGVTLTTLGYANQSVRNGGQGSGTVYRLASPTAELGPTVGITLALPVPPTGERTFLLLRGNLSYLRRSLVLRASSYGAYARPDSQIREQYRTLNARLLLGIRQYVHNFLVLEVGPSFGLAFRDDTRVRAHYLARPDSSFSTYSHGPAVGNVLLHAGLGYRPARAQRPWTVLLSYEYGLTKTTNLGLRESYAELTLHYPLRKR